MKIKTALIVAIWILGSPFSHAADTWPLIGQGINLDFSTTEVNKIGYDPAYYDVFQAAGFDSVRFFVKWGMEPDHYKEAIDGTLERGLTVVIVGFHGRTHGKEHFVDYWREFAEFYRTYPRELVFEIMNEPKMVGFPNAPVDNLEVVDWLSDAIVAIRKSNPTRVIAVGGPDYNHADMLVEYINPKHLDYKLPDGTGFEEDENIWGIFHVYKPTGWNHRSKSKPIAEASPTWKEDNIRELELADHWSKTHNKKVVMSEWGTRLPHDRNEVLEYLDFVQEESAKRNIDWFYYCGVFNNAWGYSLYTSEWGFDKTADLVETLTGQKPKLMHLPTNQINNSKFMMDTGHWYCNNQMTLNTVEGEGVDGSRALRCMVAFVSPNDPVMYQYTSPDWRFLTDGCSMLQLRQGSTYAISFYAKSTTNKTKLKVQLGHGPNNAPVFWTSEPVEINTELLKYDFTYVHDAETVENARFSIIFSDRHSEVILDEIRMVGTRTQK